MSNYDAEKIEFFDVTENTTFDLTDKDSFDYPYNHQTAGLSEGRFFLRIGKSLNEIPESSVDADVRVYSTAAGINVLSASNNPIRQIELYTVSGQKLYSNAEINRSIFTVPNPWANEHIIIVRVVTEQGVKNVKIMM
jgi:hypothetical protein